VRRSSAARFAAALAASSFLGAAPAARAGSPEADTPAKIFAALDRIVSFPRVEVSPNGTGIAFLERRMDSGGDAERQGLFLARAGRAPSAVHVPNAGPGAEADDPAWSPDGSRIVFVCRSDFRNPPQLCSASADGTHVRRITNLPGDVSAPLVLPGGKRVAFLYIAHPHRKAGPTEPTAREVGVIGSSPDDQRIAVADLENGRVRMISPPGLYIYEFDASPDGERFAATAAAPPGDDNWWIASLEIIDAANGARTTLARPEFQIASPRWSPDGRSIAVIGGLMSDEGSTGGDVYRVPARGGAPENLTPGIAASVTAIRWIGPDRILAAEVADGKSAVGEIAVSARTVRTLWTGAERISAGRGVGFSVASDGSTTAVVRDSFERPPEIAAGAVGKWKTIFSPNNGAPKFWGPARSLHWESGGRTIQGWLLAPAPNARPGPAPLVVSVHGGPASASLASWPWEGTGVLAGAGYYVLLPNPRGSFGAGEEFTRANVRDFGGGDLRDILAGVEAAAASAPIDSERVGITGWSYGGYMTMWAVTQTNRFKAAVAGAGIANWTSYYGENRIDQWMIPYFGASVYDSPSLYAKSSPIDFIKNVSTPTLVFASERDAEVPAPQSFEFWHALKTFGVPTELVVFEGEGHHVRKRAHRKERVERTSAWFDRFLRR
jgi:dipeptidyl aminopeptidase/acylaminoacyl peptidase